MKLIIDIPDNDYRHIKKYYEKNDIVEATYSYIYHGIPLDDVLDKIRAEIECLTITEGGEDYIRKMAELYSLKIKVLQIIDKYKGEQEWTSKTKH